MYGRIESALHREYSAIDEGCRIPRDEDKYFSRVIELECLQGKIAEDIFRDVIDKDKNQRETTKKV
jgi:hypothetical protein